MPLLLRAYTAFPKLQPDLTIRTEGYCQCQSSCFYVFWQEWWGVSLCKGIPAWHALVTMIELGNRRNTSRHTGPRDVVRHHVTKKAC